MTEPVYELLPAVHRLRDAEEGQPLRALLAVVGQEAEALAEDVARLRDDWFIETCAEWVVPYIGDLLGVRALHEREPGEGGSLRAYVANTIAYRRRKGTAAVLEQLAADVTGWAAHAVELFAHLGVTQHLNHSRPFSARTPDLRRGDELELLGGPFETAAHALEARRIASGRGRYAIPNVGLYLWRLAALPVEDAPASREAAGRWRFSALGCDEPLFNPRRMETAVTQLAQEWDVPGPLRRRPLHEELERLRRGEPGGRRWFRPEEPVLGLRLDDEALPVPPEQLLVCDLSDWRTPPASVVPAEGADPVPVRAAVDPVLGRIAFPAGAEPESVRVSCRFGFPARIGGGFYDRRPLLAELAGRRHYRVAVDADLTTLSDALQRWSDDGHPDGVIEFADAADQSGVDVVVPDGARLELRARNEVRVAIRLAGDWRVVLGEDADLVLDGLLVEGGGVALEAGDLSTLALRHCTLVPGLARDGDGAPAGPGEPSLRCQDERRVRVMVERCVTGPLRLAGDGSWLRAVDSAIDVAAPAGVALGTGRAVLNGCTVLGEVHVEVLELASDTIFRDLVLAARRQVGCVRFSHVPDGSRVPRRHRCVPDIPADATAAERARLSLRVRPSFTATAYPHPAYLQLAASTDAAVRRGGADEGEMGVYRHLRQPQREANLRAALDEYLRFGLEAGILHVT